MISDKVMVSEKNNECEGLETALDLVGKTALYCGFDEDESRNLREMAEEIVAGFAAVLNVFSGTMWVETENAAFDINLEMEGTFTQETREQLIAFTRDNKNTLPKGFFGKLGVLISDALTGEYAYPYGMMDGIENGEMLWSTAEITQMMAEMEQQKHDPEDAKMQKEAKEMLDMLADDIRVEARADHVRITATKALPKKAQSKQVAHPALLNESGVTYFKGKEKQQHYV